MSGQPIRGKGVQSKAQIWTVIYTTSPLGHLLELGTQAHDIVIEEDLSRGPVAQRTRTIHHPGSRRFPHFWPGLASVLPRAGQIIAKGATARTRVNAKVL